MGRDFPAFGTRRKKQGKGAPKPRFSYDKRRAAWFSARCAWPNREAPVHRLVSERSKAKRRLAAANVGEWQLVGPTNIGGRMTCAAVHPQQPDRIWAGSACGGVWYSPDAGVTWTALWSKQASLNIGSLAIDPQRPTVLYCGTGEANLSLDCYAGVGLYRSRDSGKTWKLLASCAEVGVPTRIGVVAVNPFDSNHICLGGVGHQPQDHDQSSFGGMWTSRDGGATWVRETFFTDLNYWCHSLVFDPSNRQVLFGVFSQRGARDGIWRSRDGGYTWRHLTQGLPPPDKLDRVTLAVAPSNPKVLYAQAAAGDDTLLGVFRSRDGGDTWQNVSGDFFENEGQMNYGNAIVVHPTDPDHVLCGGVNLHRSLDGGKTWQYASRWNWDRGKPHYAHSDHHQLLMPAKQPGRVYDLNDGGMDVSEDGGKTWKNRSNGLAVTMFYDLDVAQSDARVFGGGAQDNGTVLTRNGKPDGFAEIDSGDGGWMVIDPKDPQHLFASAYNVQIDRFHDGHVKVVSPPEENPDDFWMVYIDFDPKQARTVFVGTSRVWRSKTDGDTWQAVSEVLDGSPITAIDVARADSQRILIGTENGGLFRSTDGGQTWTGNLASAEIPGFQITRIESHPQRPLEAYVCIANFGARHVFRTSNGGDTWTCIDEGKLPGVPFNALVIPEWAPNTLYAAGDAGVFVSKNRGKSWLDVTANLPNVSCVDLVAHVKKRTLTVATYGRSLWQLQL